MVCAKCEKKVGKASAAPDPWKAGSKSATVGGEGRKLNENKLLTTKKRFEPYAKEGFSKCTVCKQVIHQPKFKYCQPCAFKNAVCAMCGVAVLDADVKKMSRLSTV